MPITKTLLQPFDVSPFPYDGGLPDKDYPFLDVIEGDRRGHLTQRGGVYWEDSTYADRRVLLSLPRGFDARRPALIIVYFHGNLSTLERDVRDRQQIPRQIEASRLNAVLVAPQFAVDAADSSAGRFWEPGIFAKFLREAADRLALLHGDRRTRALFRRAPVVLVAYSGGYHPAAFALTVGGAGRRVKGVILLDALYGETERFADWIIRQRRGFFVSASAGITRDGHEALRSLLVKRRIAVRKRLPRSLSPGGVTLLDTDEDVDHFDFVTQAWVDDPLRALLAKIPGYRRAAPVKSRRAPRRPAKGRPAKGKPVKDKRSAKRPPGRGR